MFYKQIVNIIYFFFT